MYASYGQDELARPRGVDPSWVVLEQTIPGIYESYAEAERIVTTAEADLIDQGFYPVGFDISRNTDGTFGPITIQYWGPPEKGAISWVLPAGIILSVLSVTGIVIAIGAGRKRA